MDAATPPEAASPAADPKRVVSPSGDGFAGTVPLALPRPVAPAPTLATARPVTRRFRLARAYGAALAVVASYVWADLVGRVRGAAWRAASREALHRRNGRRVRRAILRLRGLFVKVGQLASVLTNFLPEPFRAELEGLQDAVPAGPADAARRRIEAELGAPTDVLFATFDAEPVASASLAQVHRATLPDGRAVAVKVQHADIEAIARLDLRAIRRIVEVAAGWFGLGDQNAQLAEVEAVVVGELDFRQEADATETFAALLAPRPGLAVPDVVRERSAARVLTTTWVDGLKVSDLAGLDAAGIDRRALAAKIVDAYGQMIFRDGRYHADPHPGNLVATPDPSRPGAATLTFLDWGATATLTPEMQRGLAEFLMGTLRRDAARVTRALGLMGFVPTDAPTDGTAATPVADPVLALVERIHERMLADLDPSRFRLADLTAGFAMGAHRDTRADMDALGVSFRDLAGAFRVPRDWILLERTALLVLGVCTALDPDLNPFQRLWPFVSPLVDEREIGAVVGRSVFDQIAGEIRQTVQQVFAWPAPAPQPDEAARAEVIRSEAARVASDRAAIDLVSRRIERAARQLALSVVGTGAGGIAYAAHAAGDGWLAGGLVGLVAVCGVALTASFARGSS